jgi:signal transduction histidine kinase
MRVGIKSKQVAGVTCIVGFAVIVLSLINLTSLARVSLHESRVRGELLVNAIFHRARAVVPGRSDPEAALSRDPGLRSILESSIYSSSVTYAAIVNTSGVVIAHSDPSREGKPLAAAGDLAALLAQNGLRQIWTIRSHAAQTLEVREPLLLDGAEFGSIRIGVSTLLIDRELDQALRPAAIIAAVALLVGVLGALFFAQLILRPIHVIRGGLSRLGRGEFGVTLDLPQRDEFGELGSFFNALSTQLSADRTQMAEKKAKLESVVDHLEDAVAIFNPEGELLFANPAMRATLPADPYGRPLVPVLPAKHPYRELVEATLTSGESHGPVSGPVGPLEGGSSAPSSSEVEERLVTGHPIRDLNQRLVGVMLIARNLQYISRVQSTMNISRKLVALGRLSAGVAHEVKNPLNAMTIHLELLKQKLQKAGPVPRPIAPVDRGRGMGLGLSGYPSVSESGGGRSGSSAEESGATGTAPAALDVPAALEHVRIISGEIRHLDEVVQGFLKFMRPEDLKLQPVDLPSLVAEVVQVVGPEARKAGVTVRTECPADIPPINGDAAMLRQAFLNLALNACQAMPSGGTLRILCSPARSGHVQVAFEDTGVGIKPEHLGKIFNLYFTTKERGSGIGLSMVYRTVQLLDGEVEVQSTEGRGTTFRLILPRA